MQTQDVVNLVRQGHSFVALSKESMRQLELVRQFLCLVPTGGETILEPTGNFDPETGNAILHPVRVSTDDDALVSAIVQNMCQRICHHTHFGPSMSRSVDFGAEEVAGSNIPVRPSLLSAQEAQAAESAARIAADANQGSGALQRVDDRVPPGEPDHDPYPTDGDQQQQHAITVHDPVRCPSRLLATATGRVNRSVALLSAPLGYHSIHRASVQVLRLPNNNYVPMIEEGGAGGASPGSVEGSSAARTRHPSWSPHHPHCSFGLVSPRALAEDLPEHWVALQWNVGSSLPLAAMVTGVSTGGQPHVLSPKGHVFIREGDIITVETRPCARIDQACVDPAKTSGAPIAASPVEGASLGKAAFLRGGAGSDKQGPAPIDIYFFVNGVEVLKLNHIAKFQPVGVSGKYTPINGAKEIREHRGMESLHFGVQLAEGAKVAVLSLD